MSNIVKQGIKKCFNIMGFDIHRMPKEGNGAPLTKLSNELEYFETATGNYYLPKYSDGDGIAYAIKHGQIFDEKIYNMARNYIRPNSIVLDVGSNFGQMAILFSRVCSNVEVYAFEASPIVYPIMEKNVTTNPPPAPSPAIRPFCCAVHERSGETLYFEDYDFSKWGTYGSFGIDYLHGQGTPVQTMALDDIDYSRPISFMKIDIEGGDLFALKGARKIIEKYRMPIIFEYSYGKEEYDDSTMNFQEYVDFVADIGYRFVRCIDAINFLIMPK